MAGFKEFLLRGNVVDLAVGVMIGAAFGNVVGSVTKDIITPIIAQAGGQPDFSTFTLGPILIGNFINTVISFVITAGVIYFVIVKPFQALMARLNPPPAPGEPAPPPADIQLLTEIRDLMKKNANAAGAR